MPYIYKSGLQFGIGEVNISNNDFIGTDGTLNGSHGLVPAPSTSDRNKYLKSDGTWAVPAGGSGGTSDYEELANLPSINSHTLIDNLTFNQLGLIDFFYPVGCYFETSDTTFDPNTTWGGTWVLETEGQVHISAGTNYTVTGASTDTTDGGAITKSYTPSGSVGNHTLTTSEIPSHSHHISGGLFYKTYGSSDIVNSSIASTTTSTSGSHFYNAGQTSGATGSGGAHNHGFTGTASNINVMQPYIIVNRWHRTA